MSQATDFLRTEIAKRQSEIAVLTTALECLEGKPPVLPLPAPEKKRKQAARAGGSKSVFEVNGQDMKLGPKTAQVFEMLQQADDCCPLKDLMPLVGSKAYVQQYVSALNKKLRPAGAEILFFKGEGYRPQNIEAGE